MTALSIHRMIPCDQAFFLNHWSGLRTTFMSVVHVMYIIKKRVMYPVTRKGHPKLFFHIGPQGNGVPSPTSSYKCPASRIPT